MNNLFKFSVSALIAIVIGLLIFDSCRHEKNQNIIHAKDSIISAYKRDSINIVTQYHILQKNDSSNKVVIEKLKTTLSKQKAVFIHDHEEYMKLSIDSMYRYIEDGILSGKTFTIDSESVVKACMNQIDLKNMYLEQKYADSLICAQQNELNSKDSIIDNRNLLIQKNDSESLYLTREWLSCQTSNKLKDQQIDKLEGNRKWWFGFGYLAGVLTKSALKFISL